MSLDLLHRARLVSFDVFDTLIARRYVSQRSLLRAVASSVRSRELSGSSLDALYAARVQAEETCRSQEPSREVTLAQIALEWARLLELPSAEAATLVAIEEAVEYSTAWAVPCGLRLTWQLHDAGKELVYSSDTYHSSKFIRSLLSRSGFPTPGAKVIVSGELRKSKWRGDLFAEILAASGTETAGVVHVGNSRHADFENARRAGLDAILIEMGNPTRYELQLDAAGAAGSELGPILAGAARASRLQGRQDNDVAQSITDIGADIVATTLIPFVLWTLSQARERGLRRLFFQARDGRILALIANRLCSRAGADGLDIRYIAGGRHCYYPLALAEGGPLANTIAFANLSTTSLDTLGDQLGLPAAWYERCRSLDGLRFRPEVQLGPDAVTIRRALSDDPAWSGLLREAQRERAILATRYLSEAGVLGSEVVGVVDLGWVGRVGAALDGAARSAGHRPLTHFYFGLADNARGVCPGDSHVFYADHRRAEDQIRPLYWTALEVFCSSGEPRYIGFEVRDGTVVPQLAPDDLAHQRCTYSAHVEMVVGLAVDRFLEMLRPESFAPHELQGSAVLVALSENLASFWEHPSTQEANAWSDFRHAGGTDASTLPLARRLAVRDLVRSRWRNLLWPAGSLRLSTGYVRAAAHFVGLTRRVRTWKRTTTSLRMASRGVTTHAPRHTSRSLR
jgi:FMN phosphatase YigB (HAD superfamily)